MTIASLVRAMAEAGATPEVITLAVEAVEAEQAKDAERRAKRAAQKAKERAAKANVARQSHDSRATVGDTEATPFPQEKVPPHPPKTQPLTPCESERERPREPSDWPADYREQAWREYGQGREKKAGMAALDGLRRSGRVPWQTLIDGIRRQARSVEPQFRPSLERFIKRERWLDDYEPEVATGPPFEARPMQRQLALVNGNRQHVQAVKPSVTDVLRARIAARESG